METQAVLSSYHHVQSLCVPVLGDKPIQHVTQDAKNFNESALRKNWQRAKFLLGHCSCGPLFQGIKALSDMLRHILLTC